jgi:phosphate-selective porin OprO/OprP
MILTHPWLGHWGAFELAARFGELKLSPSIFSENFANLNPSASRATAWATGINWYLNKNAKVVFDFEQTKFDRGAAAGVNGGNRKTEDLFVTMFQLSLG